MKPPDVFERSMTGVCVTCTLSLPLSLVHQDQDGRPKQPSIDDNGDGTYRVSYVPDRTGRYTIVIKYGGDDIPASPYRVRAMASGDASKCTVTGTAQTQERKTWGLVGEILKESDVLQALAWGPRSPLERSWAWW